MRLKKLFPIFLLIATLFYFVFIREHRARLSTHQEPHDGTFGRPGEADRPEHRGPEGRSRRAPRKEQTLEADSGVSCSSEYFSRWSSPDGASCHIRFKGEFPVPDPRCTPGGANPSVSAQVLRDPRWRTRSVRNCDTSEAQKHVTYGWYSIEKPQINSNQNQVCELDHLVPLELGGADGMGNIWPQCGPSAAALNERYFKQKDRVENYLAEEVKTGRMDLGSAQRGIAADWTQYLPAATHWCQSAGRC